MQRVQNSHEEVLRKANDHIRNVAINNTWLQKYHIIPKTGWMNDPNGLIYYKGEYHVFFQYHPYSSEWGPMHWGHVKSNNLVEWEYLPVALGPSEPYDADGCFSGSAIENNGILTLIYTGNVTGDNPKQVQCIATSEDGIYFEKYLGNPVIETAPIDTFDSNFRDPKVWKHNDEWFMVVGAGENEGNGRALLYKSQNLQEWDYVGVLAESDGTQGHMWECPDLFELDDKHILIVSPIGMPKHKNIYIVGEMDYTKGKFHQEFYDELDVGPDFYAAQTFETPDGRRILFAWMNMWKTDIPTQDHGWAGSLTIPRELFLFPDGKLGMRPIKELEQLRGELLLGKKDVFTEGENYVSGVQGECLEIILTIDTEASTSKEFGICLRCSPEYSEQTVVAYNMMNFELIVDTERSGSIDGHVCKTHLSPVNGLIKIHVFLDASSIEVFGNDGRVSITNRIYPSDGSNSLYFYSRGGNTKVHDFRAWELTPTTLWHCVTEDNNREGM
jgi:beta-fructofuranosidase